MADNGLWAKLSCEEVPSSNKGAPDIKFEGSTRPNNSGSATTTTTISGVLHPDGRIEGEVTAMDDGKVTLKANTVGGGIVNIPAAGPQLPLSDVARTALEPAAKACKQSLYVVPGVSG